MQKKLKEKFNCLGENKEQYKTFSLPIKKEATRINKNGKEMTRTISYKLKFIDNTRSMAAHYQVLSIIFLRQFIKLSV